MPTEEFLQISHRKDSCHFWIHSIHD